VFSDEVASARMKAKSEKGRQEEVKHCAGTGNSIEGEEKAPLSQDVPVVFGVQGFGIHKQRPDGIEKWLKQHPKKLLERASEKHTFNGSGNISVDTINSLVSVMLQVVLLERCRVRNNQWKVGKVTVPYVVLR